MTVQVIWKRIGIILGWIGLAGIVWTAGLWTQQLRTLPRTPEPKMGKIYPRNIHGIVVYQTRHERNQLDAIQDSSIAIFATSLMMSLVYKKKWRQAQVETPPRIRTGWRPK